MHSQKAIVLGAGGFIGSNLVQRLKREGYTVTGVDCKEPDFAPSEADEFIIGDLRNVDFVESVLSQKADEVYQLAADMGGAGYLFTGINDAHVLHNSALINLHVVNAAVKYKVPKLFFSSSACVYADHHQLDPEHPNCSEESAYPAMPDSEYGWEKLFSERLYLTFSRIHQLNIRIARFHNIYGPGNSFDNGREKAPSAICRKVIQAKQGDGIEIWGDGKQTRSFLYIDDCLDGIRALMNSNFSLPVNIGSEELISINDFTKMVIGFSGKELTIKNIDGPTGVRGRNSDNKLVLEKTGWLPKISLVEGTKRTYDWIEARINKQ